MFEESSSTSNNSNVVSIANSNARRQRQPQVSLARLPAPVHRVREKATQLLQQALKKLFDGADDALFDLADKATNNQDQNIYFEAMREVRLKRRETEQAFFNRLDEAYAELLQVLPSSRSDNSLDEVSLDDLALVDNEQLEFQVALEGMIAKAQEQCAEAAQHIALRFDSLVPAKVYQQNNPLGPDLLCNGFLGVVEPLDVDIRAKLVLLKLFDKAVVANLEKIYTVINNLLIQHNVLPSLATQKSVRRSTTARRPAGDPGRADSTANPGGVTEGAAAEQLNPVLQQLRELLSPAEASHPADAEGLSAEFMAASSSSAAPVLSAGELSQVLTTLQQQAPALATRPDQPVQLLDSKQLAQLIHNQGAAHRALSPVDQDVMNLINMLFQFILDDRNLSAPMQSLLARLQLPLLKVAVVDKSFFNRAGHPARRLLNELATAALGWQPPAASGEELQRALQKDPLYKKIAAVVESVINDFDNEVGIFESLLTDFIAFTEKERRRAAVLEQRTLDAEDGKARSEYARQQVSQQLEPMLAGRRLPDCVSGILSGPWHNVMFLLYLKHGPDSDEWVQACQVVADLVWSVSAPMTAENRSKLMGMLADLLKRLRAGFELISYNPFEMNKLMQQLEAVHLQRMRAPVEDDTVAEAGTEHSAGQDELSAQPEVEEPSAQNEEPSAQNEEPSAQNEEPSAQDNEEPSAPTDTSAGDADLPVSETAKVSSGWLEQVNRFSQGSWFEVEEPGQPVFRCRLAAVIKAVDKYIFVNRNGMKVAEKTREEFAAALEAGSYRLLDDGMLFDRALESVIGSLREARGGTRR